jgi:hypothetical protein
MSPCCGVWHAGRYGSTVLLNSSECSGPCAPGYYCPIGSTLALAQACGNATVFCPSGSALPLPVLVGWYTTPDGQFDPVSRRSSAVQCAAGEFCVGGIRAPCEGGKYSGTPGQTSCAQCLAGMCWSLGEEYACILKTVWCLSAAEAASLICPPPPGTSNSSSMGVSHAHVHIAAWLIWSTGTGKLGGGGEQRTATQ